MLEDLDAVARLDDLVALAAKEPRQHHAQGGVIFGEQDSPEAAVWWGPTSKGMPSAHA